MDPTNTPTATDHSAEADEQSKSLFARALLAFVMFNVTKLISEAAICFKEHTKLPDRKSNFYRGSVKALMIVSIIVLVGKIAFTFSEKRIIGYFFWVAMANWISMLTFATLLSNIETKENFTLAMAFKNFFRGMSVLYLIVILAGFNRQHGAYCSGDDVYPTVMALLPLMFFANTGIAYYLRKNNFFMGKDHDDQKLRVNKKLIEDQGEAFYKTHKVVLILQISMFVIGKLSDSGNGAVYCSENGENWHFTSALGTIFGMAHTMSVMQQAKMCVTVFYEVPLEHGFFSGKGPKAKGD